jgi:hypothetical protein
LTREEIVRFVDIGGFIDHHYLNYLFHNWLNIKVSVEVAVVYVFSLVQRTCPPQNQIATVYIAAKQLIKVVTIS